MPTHQKNHLKGMCIFRLITQEMVRVGVFFSMQKSKQISSHLKLGEQKHKNKSNISVGACFPLWLSALNKTTAWVCRHRQVGKCKRQPAESRDDSCPTKPQARRWRSYLQPPPLRQTLKCLLKMPGWNTRKSAVLFFFSTSAGNLGGCSSHRHPYSIAAWRKHGRNKPHLRLQPFQQSPCYQSGQNGCIPFLMHANISYWRAKKCLPIIIAFNQ